MGGLREQRPPERFGLRLRDLDVTPRVRAVPTPPLLADLGRMGKKKLDMTAHDGHLVISTDLAVAIDEGQLTGVELQPVRRCRSGVDPGYRWLRVTSEWGPMAPSSVFDEDEVCPECKRSGHYDTYSEVTEFHYSLVPHKAADFNLTWEYFGFWKGPAKSGRRPVGGMRHVIVSQRVRDCLRRARVRRIGYEPVYLTAPDEGCRPLALVGSPGGTEKAPWS